MFGTFDYLHPVSGKSERAILDRSSGRWGGTDTVISDMLNEKFPEGPDARARFLGAAKELKANRIQPDNGHAFKPTWPAEAPVAESDQAVAPAEASGDQ